MEESNRCEVQVDVPQVDANGRPQGSWFCCVPCYWLQRNSSVHKASLTLTTLLVTVLLVASPVLFLISSVPGDRNRDCHYSEQECLNENQGEVCDGPECRAAASRILASMSWETDPCDDFYQFACGGWKKTSEENSEQSQRANPSTHLDLLQENVDNNIQQLLAVSASSGPFQKLGLFYKSCLRAGDKRVSLMPMFSLLKQLGGYLPPDAPAPEDITPVILQLLRLNAAPLFDIYLGLDIQNSSKLAPIIDLPQRFALDTRLWRYQHDEKSMTDFRQVKKMLPRMMKREVLSQNFTKSEPKVSRAYAYMKASLEAKRLLLMEKIMHEFMPENITTEMKAKEIHSTLLFTSMLTKLYPRQKDIIRNQQRHVHQETNIVDMQKRYPFLQWQYLLDQAFNTPISPDDTIYVFVPSYLENIGKLLPHFNKRVVHNGLLLVFATDTLHQLVNVSSSPDWPAYCTRVTINVFSRAVSALYVRQYRPDYLDQLRVRVTHMFETLKKTLESRVNAVSWVDSQTRQAVLTKLHALHGHFLAWPDFWNSSYVASLLDDVKVDPEDFFGNVIRRYQQLRTVAADFHHQPSDEKKWTFPFVVNAFYSFALNTIVIPLAVLTQPQFRADIPSYVSYSTMGLIFAHEILHGFDLKGIEYNELGEPAQLLTAETRVKLEARLDCVVKQFSSKFWKKINFLGTSVDVQFDWNVTKNENMADISGLQVAYQAWKSVRGEGEARLPWLSLSPQQLFFLNTAQTYCSTLSPEDYVLLVEVDFHTPYPERVNGVMMNSASFAEAYSCPVGSAMNPKRKCSTW